MKQNLRTIALERIENADMILVDEERDGSWYIGFEEDDKPEAFGDRELWAGLAEAINESLTDTQDARGGWWAEVDKEAFGVRVSYSEAEAPCKCWDDCKC